MEKEKKNKKKTNKSISLKVNKQSDFLQLDKTEIAELFTEYENRTFGEEIELILQYGGTNGFFQKIKSSPEGLNDDPEDHRMRVLKYNNNVKIRKELPNCCWFVWESLKDFFVRILIVCAIVQIGIGVSPLTKDPSHDWIDGMSITVAVILVVSVSSLTNYLKEKEFRTLNSQSEDMSRVTIKRNNEVQSRSDEDLLVGDIVKFGYGDILPADGLLIEGNDVKIDESTLTGESELITKERFEICLEKKEKKKSEKEKKKNMIPSPLLFSGTSIKTGQGWFLVLRVGVNSAKGQIQQKILANQEENTKTPLEEKLEDIAGDIGKFGFLAAFLTLSALMIRFGITYSELEQNKNPDDSLSKVIGMKIIKILILCIAIVVVAIPEGLPLAVTLSLAFSVKKMMSDQNLVRKIQACETMGNANYICTDKTGTLTKNIMNVNLFWDGKKTFDFSQIKEKEKPTKYFHTDYYNLLKNSVCNNLQVELDADENPKNASKTDIAFVTFFHCFGEKILKMRKEFSKIERVFPFTSDRKKMGTIIKSDKYSKGNVIFLKGASEIVVLACQYILNSANERKEINGSERIEVAKLIKSFADKALRTICVAYKELDDNEVQQGKQDAGGLKNEVEESGFTMLGIFGIRDTLRDNVERAVETCHNAGINVIMVTGDNLDTARAIAKDCGILEKDNDNKDNSMIGKDFYEDIGGLECMTCVKEVKYCLCAKTEAEAKQKNTLKIRKDRIKNLERFKEIIYNVRVLARSRPEDKYTLVTGLKQLGNVVAVTGDGTNDAEALSKSDVGFAMGIQGTDIAKEASSIIILDDNFGSIVKAVLWGRNIYDNIRKFIQFQLTVNLCAVWLVFICSCIGNETPISAIQMLWINLIMDSLGSVALSTEPPDENLLKRKPYARSEYIINYLMWKHIVFHAISEFIIMIILYIIGHKFIPEDDISRIQNIETIINCYGKLPGTEITSKQENYNVLSGKSIDWSATQKIVNSSLCFNYVNQTSLSYAYDHYVSLNGNTAHMTIIFNTFVLYTLFNQLNARVINDELNFLVNIQRNLYFILIIIIEFAFQFVIITFGSKAFNCSNDGLTGHQWGICIGFGFIATPVGFLLKFSGLERFVEYCHLLIKNISCCKKSNKIDIADSFSSEAEADEKDLITKRKHETKGKKKSKSKKEMDTIFEKEDLKD